MSTWDRLRVAWRREKKDIDAALSEFESRANAALDDKERLRSASPSEMMAAEAARARALDDRYEALRAKIEGDARRQPDAKK